MRRRTLVTRPPADIRASEHEPVANQAAPSGATARSAVAQGRAGTTTFPLGRCVRWVEQAKHTPPAPSAASRMRARP